MGLNMITEKKLTQADIDELPKCRYWHDYDEALDKHWLIIDRGYRGTGLWKYPMPKWITALLADERLAGRREIQRAIKRALEI